MTLIFDLRIKGLKIIIGLIAILFLECDHKLHVVEPKIIDPKTHRITSGPWSHGAPAWSQDGRQIAYATMTPDSIYQLRVVPSKGGTPEILYMKVRLLDWTGLPGLRRGKK